MKWRKVAVTISLGTLLGVVGASLAAGNTITTHIGLPDRVDKLETGQERIEGKLDIVIGLLRGRR